MIDQTDNKSTENDEQTIEEVTGQLDAVVEEKFGDPDKQDKAKLLADCIDKAIEAIDNQMTELDELEAARARHHQIAMKMSVSILAIMVLVIGVVVYG